MSLLSTLAAFGKRFKPKEGAKHLNPARDWLLLLAISALALIASIGWNAWFFFATLAGEPAVGSVETEQKPETSSVEKAQVLFELRATEAERYRSEYRFNDPSK